MGIRPKDIAVIPQEDIQRFQQNMREIRTALSLHQATITKMLDMNRQNYWLLENGAIRMKTNNYIAIRTALKYCAAVEGKEDLLEELLRLYGCDMKESWFTKAQFLQSL